MIGRTGYKNRVELLQGTLDMLILRTLQRAPSHGYGIVQALRVSSSEVLQVETGSLYPALHRLERHGWLHSEWKQTDSNQRARFYSITPAGRQQLAEDLGRWRQMVEVIGNILAPETEPLGEAGEA
jgi:PadR family transcriptional regulator PadR